MMHHSKRIFLRAVLVSASAAWMWGQEPSPPTAHPPGSAGDDSISAAALAGSKQDPAAFNRGGKVFATYCAGCHGAKAKGGPGAPDLVRSLLVLDDEKGMLIAPVIRDGRPDKGMPKLNLTEPQISDIVAWLHVQTYAAGHRATYEFQRCGYRRRKERQGLFQWRRWMQFLPLGHRRSGRHCRQVSDPISLAVALAAAAEVRRGGAARFKIRPAPPTVTVTLAVGQVFLGHDRSHRRLHCLAARSSDNNFIPFTP